MRWRLSARRTPPTPSCCPMQEELKRAELEARQHLPMGQRLDSARSACKKAETKAHQAQLAFQAAQERWTKPPRRSSCARRSSRTSRTRSRPWLEWLERRERPRH